MPSHTERPIRINTALTTLLGIEHPILLAPMGDTAGGQLAAAVSEAGGFGLIGGGYADPRWLAAELDAAGDARVGVGFITFALDRRPGALDLALEAGARAIQLSFGDPRPHVERIRAAGALLICQVQSDSEVERAVEAGADVIVAQGRDAGGHGRPDRGTMGLIPSMVDRVAPIPVVAAGGIADGRGLAAALMLGAAGISMGTRFLASSAARSNPVESAALVASSAADTVRSPVFDVVRGPAWPDGHDGRALRNTLTDRWEHDPDRRVLEAMYQASEHVDYGVRPLWAGEGLDLITDIDDPRTIIDRTVHEAIGRLGSARSLLATRPVGDDAVSSRPHPRSHEQPTAARTSDPNGPRHAPRGQD
jgi:nitronate monooxygenase